MESDVAKELIKKLEDLNTNVMRIAEAASVLKVMSIAMVIALLTVIVKNFMH